MRSLCHRLPPVRGGNSVRYTIEMIESSDSPIDKVIQKARTGSTLLVPTSQPFFPVQWVSSPSGSLR